MKIRYRLFLQVGGLFFIAFILSFYLENRLTKTNLVKTAKSLSSKIVQENEIKRQHIEEFLKIVLSQDLAHINAVLQRIDEIQTVKHRFEPTDINLQQGTWAESINLLMRNKWVDFVQSSSSNILLSLIIPEDVHEKILEKSSPKPGVFWIYEKEGEKIKDPYLAIHGLPISEESSSSSEDQLEMYLLFDWKAIYQYGPQMREKLLSPLECSKILEFLDVEAGAVLTHVAQHIEIAYNYLQEKSSSFQDPSWVVHEIQSGNKKSFQAHAEPLCSDGLNKYLNAFEKQSSQKDNKIFMLAGLSDFFSLPVFGSSPRSPLAPLGIARFYQNENQGKGVFSQSILNLLPLSRARSNNTDHSNICFAMNSNPEIYSSSYLNKVFIGNSLYLSKDQREGILSVGVDADDVLQKLSLVLRQTVFLAHQGRLISFFSSDGQKEPSDYLGSLPLERMLKESSGVVPCADKSLFFLRMTPFDGVDLHFFLVNLEEKEFFLIDDLKDKSKEVIQSISFELRLVAIFCLIIVLIALHNLSKKMTKPISLLAAATEKVAAGRYEEVHLPSFPQSRHDEIVSLYHSFAQMVKGLIEKEKVKGILNKVVSPEIAQEILKGDVHLGGEEKEVTVLFADIRNFTGMTEKMPPQDVIELLNTCMTKVSHEIDVCGGVIDKYVGDEVMALFGAPLSQEDSALKAIRCALKMMEILKEWNQTRKEKGVIPVEMGVGIHTGIVVAGNMGAENRLNYTVLGSNVNLAARLCGSAERMEILISEKTLNAPHVKENVRVVEKGSMSFKGFAEPVKVYQVINLTSL